MRLVSVAITRTHVTVGFTYSNLQDATEPMTSVTNDIPPSLSKAMGDRFNANVLCGDHDKIVTTEADGLTAEPTDEPTGEIAVLMEEAISYGRDVLDHIDAGYGSDLKEA